MIVFGTAITDEETYERCAAPGIRVAAEPDSKVLAHPAAGSIFRSYNLILDRAAAHEDLEALVLVHQDAEIVDPDFCEKIRRAVRDPDVAIVGCAGAIGVHGIAWWDATVTWASFTHRYRELGGGEFPGATWDAERIPSYNHTGEVDSIDGFVMGLSPWAVRELRFDESLGTLHGYDFDICMQARAAGKKVVTEDFRAIHHHSLELISDPEAWTEAYIRVVEKWDGSLHDADPDRGDLRKRLRRAEAEAAAARGVAKTAELQRDATRRELARARDSASWRLTRPLRGARRMLARMRRQ
jgi:hypothetical protein